MTVATPLRTLPVLELCGLVEFTPDGFRIAYLSGGSIRVVAGDGTGENFQGITGLSGVQTHAKGGDSLAPGGRLFVQRAPARDHRRERVVSHDPSGCCRPRLRAGLNDLCAPTPDNRP